MRLINIRTFAIEEFLSTNAPPYAILSHTWELEHPHLILFGSDWNKIGGRNSFALPISAAAGINEWYLTQVIPGNAGQGDEMSRMSRLQSAPIAEKLSWAARRHTTRSEDMAYCLLGLCGVSMPLFYGEGSNAFLRLQEEIIRRKFDPSLLAWELPSVQDDYGTLSLPASVVSTNPRRGSA
ncbi:hypothetical protein BX600DRAFT_513311 [Xylariales sp. PMI_506]|nr:hypothetical protein BX600DRAFT_513311 [Xylariales sp. PMI_506]